MDISDGEQPASELDEGDSINQDHDTDDFDQFIGEEISNLWSQVAEVSLDFDEIAKRAEGQVEVFSDIREDAKNGSENDGWCELRERNYANP